ENRGVPEYSVRKIGGEALLQRAHRLPDLARHFDRIRSRSLIDADRGRWCAVEATVAVLRSRAQFHAGNVLDADNRAIGIGAQDNAGELLRSRQPARGLDIDLNLLLARARRRAHPAERRLNILVLH